MEGEEEKGKGGKGGELYRKVEGKGKGKGKRKGKGKGRQWYVGRKALNHRAGSILNDPTIT